MYIDHDMIDAWIHGEIGSFMKAAEYTAPHVRIVRELGSIPNLGKEMAWACAREKGEIAEIRRLPVTEKF